jgi:D-serine dehydratase
MKDKAHNSHDGHESFQNRLFLASFDSRDGISWGRTSRAITPALGGLKKGIFMVDLFVFTLLGHLADRRRVRLLLYSLLVLLTPTCLLCNFFM